MFKENNFDKERKPVIDICFGLGGHENEYIMQIRPGGMYSDPVNFPWKWEDELTKKLGREWGIMNRGQRLELRPPNPEPRKFLSSPKRTEQTDAAIREILSSLIGPEYEIRFNK